jgi:hypothetical protein
MGERMTLIDSRRHRGEPKRTEGVESQSMRSMRRFPTWHLLAPLAIFCGTLFLRILCVGGPPFTDEGTYAFNAEMVWRGARAFPTAPINLYPPLIRWVGMPSATPLLYVRMADALVAAGAAVMLFLFLSRWVESWIAFVMASAWSITANLPMFVEAGFKNSIMAATLVYLGSLWFLASRSRSGPLWAGLLIPLAVFLREPFLPIVIVSLYLAAAAHGRRGVMLHFAGLVVAGCALLLWIYLFRGTPSEVLGYFLNDLAIYYAHFSEVGMDPANERWRSLRVALSATMCLMPPAFLGVGWLFSRRQGERVAKGLALLLFQPPLCEILTKYCTPYHWAQLLLPIAFLGAMGLRWLSTLGLSPNRWLMISVLAVVAWLVGELDSRNIYRAYRDGYRLSRQFAPVMIWGHWDDPSVERSFYLEVAKYIRDTTIPNDRIVVSGFGHVLFPLSGRLPPSASSFDLALMSAMRFPVRRPEIIENLRQHPPHLVVELLRAPAQFHDYWPDFDTRYHLAKEFRKRSEQHYGWVGARVWELTERRGG